MMSWEDIKDNKTLDKATERQIKYAEKLLEELHGDICYPIYDMSKDEISKLIDKCLKIKEAKENKKRNARTDRLLRRR